MRPNTKMEEDLYILMYTTLASEKSVIQLKAALMDQEPQEPVTPMQKDFIRVNDCIVNIVIHMRDYGPLRDVRRLTRY